MPALAQALSGALPEEAVRQLMQALGNCQQPLSHRGAVNLQPPDTTGPGGVARPGTWRPSDYRDLLPTAGQNAFVDVPGYGGYGGGGNSLSNSHNYAGDQFQFPINQDFRYSNYFGGDTFNVAGNSSFDNSSHQNLNAQRLNVNYINNQYVGGENEPGMDGAAGADGQSGITLALLGGGGVGPILFPFSSHTITYLKDVKVRGTVASSKITEATVKAKAVKVNTKEQPITVAVSGSILVPTVKSAKISSPTAKGTASVPTVTGGALSGAIASGDISYDVYKEGTCSAPSGSVSIPTSGSLSGATAGGDISYDVYDKATCSSISGTVSVPASGSLTSATAGGNISYDVYDKATCSAITGTVAVPTGGTFSGTPTGMTVSATAGGLVGTVQVQQIKSITLDDSCNIQWTTEIVAKTVTFSGDIGVSLTPGTVTGTVSLSASTSAKVTISTPTITPTKSTGTATASLNVSGSVTLSGSTDKTISLSAPTISLTKSQSTAKASLAVQGGTVELSGSTTTTVTFSSPTITLTPSKGTAKAELTVNGGKFQPTAGSTDVGVTLSEINATVTLEPGEQSVGFDASGSATVTIPSGTGELTNDAINLVRDTESTPLKLTVVPKSDFLIYLRPRM